MHDDVPPSPFKGGDVIEGKYRVVRTLGMGGMGVVLLAKHLGLDELVALKFLHRECLTNKELVQRFIQEGRAAAKIKGDHCIRMLDVAVTSDGIPYMVMEYLEGTDLQQYLAQRKRISPVEAVDHILEASAAIAEAHRIGIVHRDLKTSNLFLVPDGHGQGGVSVKVLDFGISKVMPTHAAQAALTQTRDVFGSPLYMSPEQMKSSAQIDPRTDIWSLGVVLYELVAGVCPFAGGSMAQVCAAVLQDDPARLPTIPPPLEAAILRCLAKNPDQRPQSVAELSALLLPFASPRGQAAGAKIRAITAKLARGSDPNLIPPPGVAMPGGAPVAPGRMDATGGTFSTTMRARVRTNVVAAALAGVGVAGLIIIAAAFALKHRSSSSSSPAPAIAPSEVATTATATPDDPPSSAVAVEAPAPTLDDLPAPPATMPASSGVVEAAPDAGAVAVPKVVAPRRGTPGSTKRAGFGGRD